MDRHTDRALYVDRAQIKLLNGAPKDWLWHSLFVYEICCCPHTNCVVRRWWWWWWLKNIICQVLVLNAPDGMMSYLYIVTKYYKTWSMKSWRRAYKKMTITRATMIYSLYWPTELPLWKEKKLSWRRSLLLCLNDLYGGIVVKHITFIVYCAHLMKMFPVSVAVCGV